MITKKELNLHKEWLKDNSKGELFLDKYLILSSGDIVSLVRNHKLTKTPVVLKPSTGNGYKSYVLTTLNGVRKTYRGHRLVAWAFLGLNLSDASSVVHHINAKKGDNRLSNLKIVSLSTNTKEAWALIRKSKRARLQEFRETQLPEIREFIEKNFHRYEATEKL